MYEDLSRFINILLGNSYLADDSFCSGYRLLLVGFNQGALERLVTRDLDIVPGCILHYVTA